MTRSGPIDTKAGAALLKAAAPAGRVHLNRSMAAALAGGFFMVVCAWILADVVDRVAFGQAGLAEVLFSLSALAGLYLLRGGLGYVADQQGAMAAIAVKTQLRGDIAQALQGRLLHQENQTQAGSVLNTLVEGVEALHPYFARYMTARAVTVFVPLAILVVVFPVDWISGLVLGVTAPLIPFFMILIGRNAERQNQRQWAQLSRLNGHFLEAIRGLPTLKLFGAARREAALMARSHDDLRHETMGVLRLAFLSSLTLEFFATVSIAIVAVLIGFRLLWGDIAFHRAFLVLLLAPEFYLPLRRMGTHYHARMEALAAGETIAGVLAQGPVEDTGTQAPDDGAIGVTLEHATYFYAGRDAGVTGISLEIPAGMRTVIVGPSGAGKTTLLALIMGMVTPQAGVVRAGDVPLGDIAQAAWRSRMGYVPQRAHLFAGSVRDAIRMGQPDAGDAEIDVLAAELGIGDIVMREDVMEDAAALSGGQIQRVAVARALLRGSGLLVMDEPSAHLDAESARLIHAALHRRRGQTMVIVTHKPETVMDADYVVVLRDGQVEDVGPRVDVAARNAFLAGMMAEAA